MQDYSHFRAFPAASRVLPRNSRAWWRSVSHKILEGKPARFVFVQSGHRPVFSQQHLCRSVRAFKPGRNRIAVENAAPAASSPNIDLPRRRAVNPENDFGVTCVQFLSSAARAADLAFICLLTGGNVSRCGIFAFHAKSLVANIGQQLLNFSFLCCGNG